MTITEKLAREISRVTKVHCHYENMCHEPGIEVQPVLTMIEQATERAFLAIGNGHAVEQMDSVKELEGFCE